VKLSKRVDEGKGQEFSLMNKVLTSKHHDAIWVAVD